jgi:hypothetical protein
LAKTKFFMLKNVRNILTINVGPIKKVWDIIFFSGKAIMLFSS